MSGGVVPEVFLVTLGGMSREGLIVLYAECFLRVTRSTGRYLLL